eukprot:Hpha_TRINITY_DN14989_c0_g3::TRINITY_DN14989_c0_g3_i1::g.143151::m.143151
MDLGIDNELARVEATLSQGTPRLRSRAPSRTSRASRGSRRGSVCASDADASDEPLPTVKECVQGLVGASNVSDEFLWLQDLSEHLTLGDSGLREVRSHVFSPSVFDFLCSRIAKSEHAALKEGVLSLFCGVLGGSSAAQRRQLAASGVVLIGLRAQSQAIVAAAALLCAALCSPSPDEPGADEELASRLTAEGVFERLMVVLPAVYSRGSPKVLEAVLAATVGLATLQAANVLALSVRRQPLHCLLDLPREDIPNGAPVPTPVCLLHAAHLLRLVASTPGDPQGTLAMHTASILPFCLPTPAVGHPSDSRRAEHAFRAIAALLKQDRFETDVVDLRKANELVRVLRERLRPHEGESGVEDAVARVVNLMVLPEVRGVKESKNLEAFGEVAIGVLAEQLFVMAAAGAEGMLQPEAERDTLHTLRTLGKVATSLQIRLPAKLLPLGSLGALLRRHPLSSPSRELALLARSVCCLLLHPASVDGLRTHGVEPDPTRCAGPYAPTDAESLWINGRDSDLVDALTMVRAVRLIQKRWRGVMGRKRVEEEKYSLQRVQAISARLLRQASDTKRDTRLDEYTARVDVEEKFAEEWHRIASGARVLEFERNRLVREVQRRQLDERREVNARHEGTQAELLLEEQASTARLEQVQARERLGVEEGLRDAADLRGEDADAARASLRAQLARLSEEHTHARVALHADLAKRRAVLARAGRVEREVLEERQHRFGPLRIVELEEEQGRGQGQAGYESWWCRRGIVPEERAAWGELGRDWAVTALALLARCVMQANEAEAVEELGKVHAAATVEGAEVQLAELRRREAEERDATVTEWEAETRQRVLPGYDYLRRWLLACRQVSDWMVRNESVALEEVRRVVVAEWGLRTGLEIAALRCCYGLRMAVHWRAASIWVPLLEAPARRRFLVAESDEFERLEVEAEEGIGRTRLSREYEEGASSARLRLHVELLDSWRRRQRRKAEGEEVQERALLAAQRVESEVLLWRAALMAAVPPETSETHPLTRCLLGAAHGPTTNFLITVLKATTIELPPPSPSTVSHGDSHTDILASEEPSAETPGHVPPQEEPQSRAAVPGAGEQMAQDVAGGQSALRLGSGHPPTDTEPPPPPPVPWGSGAPPAAAAGSATVPARDKVPKTIPAATADPTNTNPSSLELVQRSAPGAHAVRLLACSVTQAPPPPPSSKQTSTRPPGHSPASPPSPPPSPPRNATRADPPRLTALRAAVASDTSSPPSSPSQSPRRPLPPSPQPATNRRGQHPPRGQKAGSNAVSPAPVRSSASPSRRGAEGAGSPAGQRAAGQRGAASKRVRDARPEAEPPLPHDQTMVRANPPAASSPPRVERAPSQASVDTSAVPGLDPKQAQRRAAARAAKRVRLNSKQHTAPKLGSGAEKFDAIVALLQYSKREVNTGLRHLVRAAASSLQQEISKHSPGRHRRPVRSSSAPPQREGGSLPQPSPHPRAPPQNTPAASPARSGGPAKSPHVAKRSSPPRPRVDEKVLEREKRVKGVVDRLARREVVGTEGEARADLRREERKGRAAWVAQQRDEYLLVPEAPPTPTPVPLPFWRPEPAEPNGARTPPIRESVTAVEAPPVASAAVEVPVTASELLSSPSPPRKRQPLSPVVVRKAPAASPGNARERSGNGPPGSHMLRHDDSNFLPDAEPASMAAARALAGLTSPQKAPPELPPLMRVAQPAPAPPQPFVHQSPAAYQPFVHEHLRAGPSHIKRPGFVPAPLQRPPYLMGAGQAGGVVSPVLEEAYRAQLRREQLVAAAQAQRSLADLDRLHQQQEWERARAESRQIFLMGRREGRERYVHNLHKAPAFDSSPAAPVDRHKLRPFRKDIY